MASRACFQDLAADLKEDFALTPNGLLMLCKTEKSFNEEAETAELARQLDVDAEVLDAQATSTKDPSIEMDVTGSIYYPRDCHLSPQQLMHCLQSELSMKVAASMGHRM